MFKALATYQSRLGLRVGDVKSSVVLSPLPADELQRAAQRAACAALRQAGWHALDGATVLGTDFLAAAPGASVEAPAVRFRLQVDPPSGISCTVQSTGLLPKGWCSMAHASVRFAGAIAPRLRCHNILQLSVLYYDTHG